MEGEEWRVRKCSEGGREGGRSGGRGREGGVVGERLSVVLLCLNGEVKDEEGRRCDVNPLLTVHTCPHVVRRR